MAPARAARRRSIARPPLPRKAMSVNFSLLRAHPADVDADAVIVAVSDDAGLLGAARALDERSGARLAALLASGDASGKPGRTLLAHGLPGIKAARVLLVGVGESTRLDTARYSKLSLDALRALKGTPVKRAVSYLPERSEEHTSELQSRLH